jgi:hypothetical protein
MMIAARSRETREDFRRGLAMRAIVDDIRAQGITSVRKITDELNRRDILTARGAAWHPTTTARLLARLA